MSLASPAEHVGRITVLALCGCALCQPLVAHGARAETPALDDINLALNHRIVQADDAATWGRADHWATPDELRARGAGDCEDYAIAKYFALLDAGWSAAQLRLVVVRLVLGGGELWQPHMVLAYLPSLSTAGDEQILDNVLDEIRPLSRRPDLRVLISFNQDGVWAGLDRGPPAREARQIVPWARVLERMQLAH